MGNLSPPLSKYQREQRRLFLSFRLGLLACAQSTSSCSSSSLTMAWSSNGASESVKWSGIVDRWIDDLFRNQSGLSIVPPTTTVVSNPKPPWVRSDEWERLDACQLAAPESQVRTLGLLDIQSDHQTSMSNLLSLRSMSELVEIGLTNEGWAHLSLSIDLRSRSKPSINTKVRSPI